ncbi:MAG: hypothetical protein QWI36_03645 [Wolbachia endosymbiont of Tyrophagus putrescentiae]|nr:hypothetical protein [Wolbachia endosymbiont of Tyrophagus putrescentiae]
MLFARDKNVPTFHVLNKKYLKERKIADRRVKRYNNVIYISVATCAIGLVAVYPHIGITMIIGVLKLIIAIEKIK